MVKGLFFTTMSNYAFIDSQNLYLGIKNLGWKLDYKRFRVYLKDKYNIEQAYLFIGFAHGNENLYMQLQLYGYICIFKPTLELPGENRKNGKPYSLVFAQRAVVRPNTPLWCQHLGFVPKEIKMIPASQMHSYTDIHKAKREAQKLAGISEALERDLRMKMDLACGQGNYSCIYNATSHAEAELITRFLQDHGYNAYTLGQDIQISW
jgi:hypothetical protein